MVFQLYRQMWEIIVWHLHWENNLGILQPIQVKG